MPGGRIVLAAAAGRPQARSSSTSLFFLLLSVSTFFFLLVVVLMMVFVVVYRRRPRSQPQASPSHNTLLEILWTGIPAVIVAIVFYRGFTDYLELRTPPAGAKEIRVTGEEVELAVRVSQRTAWTRTSTCPSMSRCC